MKELQEIQVNNAGVCCMCILSLRITSIKGLVTNVTLHDIKCFTGPHFQIRKLKAVPKANI